MSYIDDHAAPDVVEPNLTSETRVRGEQDGKPLGPHLSLAAITSGPAILLAPIGELDLSSSGALDRELEQAFASESELVILDLRKLEFMDSTGLSALVKAQRAAEQTGKRFALVRGSRQVSSCWI
jgi:anti-anti-sigma factor